MLSLVINYRLPVSDSNFEARESEAARSSGGDASAAHCGA